MSKKSRELTDNSAGSVSGGILVDMGNGLYNVVNESTGRTIAKNLDYLAACEKAKLRHLSRDVITLSNATNNGYNANLVEPETGPTDNNQPKYHNHTNQGYPHYH